MTKLSLALLARQKHPQMRWIPVACKAAGPLLQFWGCVTNQVIALGRVHPPHRLHRPPFPAHLGGRGAGRGVAARVHRHPSRGRARCSLPSASSASASASFGGPAPLRCSKNSCHNKRALKWVMSVINYCTVKGFIQQDHFSTGKLNQLLMFDYKTLHYQIANNWTEYMSAKSRHIHAGILVNWFSALITKLGSPHKLNYILESPLKEVMRISIYEPSDSNNCGRDTE